MPTIEEMNGKYIAAHRDRNEAYGPFETEAAAAQAIKESAQPELYHVLICCSAIIPATKKGKFLTAYWCEPTGEERERIIEELARHFADCAIKALLKEYEAAQETDETYRIFTEKYFGD